VCLPFPAGARSAELHDLATDTSGPNSVLRSSTIAFEVPLRFHGCTDEHDECSDLMVNVPHSGACPAENVRLGTERLGPKSRTLEPKGSLERR